MSSNDNQKRREFVRSLTGAEKTYLWSHVFRYAGVEGVSAKEQFARLIMYVLNFFNGDSDIEKRVFAKALQMF